MSNNMDSLVAIAEQAEQEEIQAEEAAAAAEETAAMEQVAAASEEAASEPQQQVEKTYSTRGRSAGAGADSNADPLERLAREALGDLHNRTEKEKPVTMGSSFLSESLTEEERRTRTRYLPEVDGMHALRKHEIKGDLQLARSVQTSAGVSGTLTVSASAKASSNKNKRARDEDGMEVDTDEGMAPSGDDDRASDISFRTGGTKTLEVGTTELVVPSSAFVAPGDGAASAKKDANKRNPREVEAVTAFNPPRPPESVGAKKKHRMKRWERRPADIEVDLNNYNKTLKKTRRELKSAEAECERIQNVENLLRLHYFNHLECLNEEWIQLNDELSSAHQECVNAADLLTSRTRSRGAGKGSYVMKDVLAVLRARGVEIQERSLSLDKVPKIGAKAESAGAGGVGVLSFQDWDRSTKIKPTKAAEPWILPGDKVETPYGEGTVVTVYGPSRLNAKEPPHSDLVVKASPPAESTKASAVDSSGDTPMTDAPAAAPAAQPEPKPAETKADDTSSTSGKKKKGSKKSKEKPLEKGVEDKLETVPPVFFLAPRVAVRLSFGVGFFPVSSVVTDEDPSKYSDERLALRWKGMAETAPAMGQTLDIQAMAEVEESGPSQAMDTMDDGAAGGEGAVSSDKQRKLRLLPFGSGMLPTVEGRGALLAEMDLNEVSSGIRSALYDGGGVLGDPDNQGVPEEVRKLETQRQQYIDLKARVLQLRNELYRQRRTRLLNERTLAATEERSLRVEALVTEMRADLSTLKSRLDEEVRALGISEEEAESMLTNFYRSLDIKLAGEKSPPKRARRPSRMEEIIDDDDDDDEPMQPAMSMD